MSIYSLDAFPIWNQSVFPCPVLLLPDLHTDFSRCRSGGLVFPSLEEFSTVVVIHTVKGFGVVNEADVFLEFSCFFHDPTDVGNLTSGSSAFSKSSLNIWKFSGHVLLKSSLENFTQYFTSLWDQRNCAVVWTFFGIALLWDWNDNWPFLVLWSLLSFPNLLAYWMLHFNSVISFRIWNSSAGIPSPPLILFVVLLPN